MNDDNVDDLLRGLKAPGPVPMPPPIPVQAPWYRRPWVGGVALAAGLLLAVGLSQRESGRVTARGDGETVVSLSLSLSAVRDGQTERLDGTASVGEPLYFRLSATPAAEAVLWVEGPAGREEIAEVSAVPTEQTLQGGSGHIGYIADAPGTYTFHLGAGEAVETVRIEVGR